MTPATEHALAIGTRVARAVFRLRGDRSEIHLSEAELAAVATYAVEQAYRELQVRPTSGNKTPSNSV